jgi:ubiquinone/menaquinone biosynthesis C-methylase UbiE
MTTTATTTRPMPSARRYDLKLWWASRGKEGVFRDKQVELARIAPGEAVLDLGCGTGTLAIAAAAKAGPSGSVCGVDPSLELLARAEKKASRAGVDVRFLTASGERLPFDDDSFDVVLSTLVFHHLPGQAVHDTIAEIRRVLRPEGRWFCVDIGGEQEPGRKTFHGHASFDLVEFFPKLSHVGFAEVEHGPIESGIRGLEKLVYFVAAPA